MPYSNQLSIISMERCNVYNTEGVLFRFNEGDPYSIRYLDSNILKYELNGLILHHFVHIIHKNKDTNKTCFFTFGMKSDELMNPDRRGATYGTSYSKTILQAPDFSDLICSSKVNKCFNQYKDINRCKNQCIGIKGISKPVDTMIMQTVPSDRKAIAIGKVATHRGKQYQGTLNETQTKILNFFIEDSHIKNRNGVLYREYQLPFTFSFLADVCHLIDWQEKEYYNCKKFAFTFHDNPSKIWKVLKTQRVSSLSEIVNLQQEYTPPEALGDAFDFVMEKYLQYFNNIQPQLQIEQIEYEEIVNVGSIKAKRILANNEFLPQATAEDLSLLALAILFAVLSQQYVNHPLLSDSAEFYNATVGNEFGNSKKRYTWKDLLHVIKQDY